MFELLFWFGFFVVLIVGSALACGIWRVNMMVNHPEKYRRFREFEKDWQQDFKRSADAQGELARKAGTVAAKGAIMLATRFLKK